MSFGIALSGLDAAQSDLDTTANNIANASTTGFKSSDSQFSELFSAAAAGVSDTQIGGGVELSDVQQQFSQGDIETTVQLAMDGSTNSVDVKLFNDQINKLSGGGSPGAR